MSSGGYSVLCTLQNWTKFFFCKKPDDLSRPLKMCGMFESSNRPFSSGRPTVSRYYNVCSSQLGVYPCSKYLQAQLVLNKISEGGK